MILKPPQRKKIYYIAFPVTALVPTVIDQCNQAVICNNNNTSIFQYMHKCEFLHEFNFLI